MMFLGQAASLRPSISTAKPTRLPWVTTPVPQAAGSGFSESSVVSLASEQPGSKSGPAPRENASTWPSPSSSTPLEHCGAAAGGAVVPPPLDGGVVVRPAAGGAGGGVVEVDAAAAGAPPS